MPQLVLRHALTCILLACFCACKTTVNTPLKSPKTQARTPPRSDQTGIRHLDPKEVIAIGLKNWNEAFNRGDLEACMDLFATNLVAIYSGQPDRGHAELRELLAPALKPSQQQYRYELQIEEIMVEKEMAFVRLIWTLKTRQGASEEISRDRGLDVFKLQNDGRWRIIRFMAFPLLEPVQK